MAIYFKIAFLFKAMGIAQWGDELVALGNEWFERFII